MAARPTGGTLTPILLRPPDVPLALRAPILLPMMMQTDTTAVAQGRQAFWTGEGSWLHQMWLPPQSSTTAHEIDALFYFILITSFILTR